MSGRAHDQPNCRLLQGVYTVPTGSSLVSASASTSALAAGAVAPQEAGGDDNQPLDLSWPDTWRERITYVIFIPIIVPLWLTLPDSRKPSGQTPASHDNALWPRKHLVMHIRMCAAAWHMTHTSPATCDPIFFWQFSEICPLYLIF